jgi:hypothetical protein
MIANKIQWNRLEVLPSEYKILHFYRGEMNNKVLKSIMYNVELKMRAMKEPPPRIRQVNNVVIEAFQNLIYHKEPNINHHFYAPLALVAKIGKHYLIQTGNPVRKEKGAYLKSYIDHINSFSEEDLENYYRTVLCDGKFNPEGGAGLGMLDMARRTVDHKLHYELEPINEEYDFFHFYVIV